MNNNPLISLEQLGQQVWLDNLSRTLLREGTLDKLIEQDGVSGVTSNPAIFFNALSKSPYYQEELAQLKTTDLSAETRYERLVIADIQAACDKLAGVFRNSNGDAGYVSLEVSPHLKHDEDGTVAAARRLKAEVSRDNLLVKVPATPAGIRAIERLIAEGINVNVTLMFSLAHETAVANAYIRGARQWVANGGNPRSLKSVASIFMSRVDTLVDQKLEAIGSSEALALRGSAAVALGKLAYQQYWNRFHGAEFADLAAHGVRPQYPLWASTGTKNAAYSDVLYVEPLIAAETVNTLPDATLAAFRDHGHTSTATASMDVAAAEAHRLALLAQGIDLDVIGEQLQVEGLELFVQAYDKLLGMMV